MDNRSKSSALHLFASRQAAAAHLALFDANWDGETASARAESDDWEVAISVRSRRPHEASPGVSQDGDKTAGIQGRVLRVLSTQPMRPAAIAAAIGSEDGRYLRRAIRALYNAGKVTQHVKGWVRHAA